MPNIKRIIDISGKKFGSIFVEKIVTHNGFPKTDKNNYSLWECKCDCGNRIIMSSYKVKRNKTCGECWKSMVGKTFGYLLVCGKSNDVDNGNIMLMCVCRCGERTSVRAVSLKYKKGGVW